MMSGSVQELLRPSLRIGISHNICPKSRDAIQTPPHNAKTHGTEHRHRKEWGSAAIFTVSLLRYLIALLAVPRK